MFFLGCIAGGLSSPHGGAVVPAPLSSLMPSGSQQQQQQTSRSTPTPSSTTSSSSVLFPPPLQNVETFGSFLGEEIVANWRRSLERSIMSQQPVTTTTITTTTNSSSTSLNRLPSPTDQSSPVKSSSGTPMLVDTIQENNNNNNSSSKAPTPGPGRETPSSTPGLTSPPPSSQPSSLLLGQELLGNGLPMPPKSPAIGQDDLSMMTMGSNNNNSINNNNNNNNSHHLANNNHNNTVSLTSSMLDSLKGPFRFDERTHPFRFGDEYGAAGMAGRIGESLIPKGDPMEARLQEMLRYNMDKYATQNLDTLHISRRVRELLSIHNIGQRLFAKYVLGLSQGTVSELLSKPKPWDKLTEKGRDSYRKMHAWACDDNAVLLLKSLIPKKGEYFSLALQINFYTR